MFFSINRACLLAIPGLAAALLAGCGAGGGVDTTPSAVSTSPAAAAATVQTAPVSSAGSSSSIASTATPAASTTFAFTPNYVSDLVDGLASWRQMPVTIYFTPDANDSPQRESIALTGFDKWVSATGGILSFQMVSNANSASLVIHFDPTQSNSLTVVNTAGTTIKSATMALGLMMPNNISGLLPASDLEAAAAHEFGHALGIEGHSTNPADLMYWQHTVGRPWTITARDLNTMKMAYLPLFAPSRAIPFHSMDGPERTITLK